MKVDKIYNHTNFHGIYRTENSKFSPIQKKIASSIVKSLQKPLSALNGETAENFHKMNNSIDFVIGAGKRDSVILNGVRGAIIKNVDNHKTISYKHPILIGEYSRINSFEPDDIVKSLNQYEKTESRKGLMYFGLLIGMLFMLWFGAKVDQIDKNNNTEQKIEKFDSIQSNQDTLELQLK